MKMPFFFVIMLLGTAYSSPAHSQSCSLSVSDLVFKDYNSFSNTPATSTASINVTCSNILGSYSIGLNAGSYGGGSFNNRRLLSNASYLSYQLYASAAHDVIWGDGTQGTRIQNGACGRQVYCTATFFIYGVVPARQIATPGFYIDNIVVMISF